jgi:CheY-like chemotaxis protein
MAPRILYVEDHDDTRVLMAILLKNAGFEVTEAANGIEALKQAKAEKFDLYLLDHTFPDASGVTICKALREFDAHTPIIFYSARAMEQEREEAINAGAQDYLIKPNDLFNVAEHVSRWIEASQKNNQEVRDPLDKD